MQVRARIERVDEASIFGDVREDAQLDLRIIRNDELAPLRRAKATPVLDRVRHLLHVRMGTRESSGRCADLVEVGVDAAGDGIDLGEDVFAVAGERLLDGAVFE
jgi:hypothetical protein